MSGYERVSRRFADLTGNFDRGDRDLRTALIRIKRVGREASAMFVLAESATIPANAAGIVTTVLGLGITVAWLAYLYR
jgi:hypothetical protein